MAASRRKASTALLATSSLALVACDALLGLGSYHDVACESGCDAAPDSSTLPKDGGNAAETSPPFEAGTDADAEAASDADSGVVTFEAGLPVPSAHEIWAHWP
ncbi:MAG TPA: hypothetical protein VHS09_04275, partial [Polyangiaceae bacterium]|nr:hypothetical protein [Polyangiaceae bacterium]